ncbi:hypothetical protein [Microvirga sp. VF16]|uniref:hypothetical protein n=1 Tax=Microvirga sp. VF16 TaxID=2807101 RepID=UPI00193E48F9|nr:hypothetical protein [Microvirga sp. VF16]QRM35638.1 hypothetical protein JO965_43210 [Microvirga sp. VF16]
MDDIPFYIMDEPVIDLTFDMPDFSIPEPAVITLFDVAVSHTTSIPAPIGNTEPAPEILVGDFPHVTLRPPSDEDVRFLELLDMLSKGNGYGVNIVAVDENFNAKFEYYLDADGDGQREYYTREELLEKYAGTAQAVG